MTDPRKASRRTYYRAVIRSPYRRWVVSCGCAQCLGAVYRDGSRNRFGPFRGLATLAPAPGDAR